MICSSACSRLLDLGWFNAGACYAERSGANDITDLRRHCVRFQRSMGASWICRGRPYGSFSESHSARKTNRMNLAGSIQQSPTAGYRTDVNTEEIRNRLTSTQPEERSALLDGIYLGYRK